MTDQAQGWLQRNWGLVLGWGIQLIFLGVYIGRQETLLKIMDDRVTNLETRLTAHHEDRAVHLDWDWKAQINQRFDRLEQKLDTHMATR